MLLPHRPPHRRPLARSALAVVVLAALVLALSLAPATAQALDEDAAVAWLLDQHAAGGVTTRGALADLIFGLLGVGAAPDVVADARADLEAQTADYVGAGGADPGQLGKALLAIQVAGGEGTDVGGVDLEALLRGLEQSDGDPGRFGTTTPFNQALAVMALATTEDGPSSASAAWLAGQACPDGALPAAAGQPDGAGAATPCTTAGTGDVDTTALAVQALLGDAASATTVEAAAAWLVQEQAADGSFLTNSNSTGLAAQALRALGRTGPADAAAAFVATLQIPAGQPDAGAIRYRAADDGSLFLATTQGLLAASAPAFPRLGAAAPAPVGDGCAPGAGVTVVVDLSAFDAGIRQGCAPGDPATGLDALTGAGFAIVTQDADFGTFVCAIEGLPELACDQPFEGSFWAYAAGQADGTWVAQEAGAGATDPGPGDVEGWRWGAGDGPAVPAPTPTPPLPDTVTRLAGDSRTATAVAISADAFADATAGGVVLARDDAFADALAGAPLAAAVDGPLLITPSTGLPDAVVAEIQRVLPTGGAVHVLGGTVAVDEAVVAQLRDLGYAVERIAGDDRVTTAVAVARELGDPGTLLITTGDAFPDALAAGTAAAATGDGAVLLTGSGTPHPALDAYLTERGDADVVAVGGPATTAYPDATPVTGATREETAVAVARAFFDGPAIVGVARSGDFADALAGGPRIAALGGPMLLTSTGSLSPAVAAYVCEVGATAGVVFGGTAAVSDAVVAELDERLTGSACG